MIVWLVGCLFSLPMPNEEKINLKKMEGGFAAAVKFSGKPTEDVVREKENELRKSLSKDGLKAKTGCMLARYNDPGRTWSFIMVCVQGLAITLFCDIYTMVWL